MELCLTGEIFDTTADEINAQIDAHKNEHIDLYIDSPGGDVFGGLRICKKIAEHGDITAKCGVVVASIASVIAFTCQKIEVTNDTFLMVHMPWTTVCGNAAEIKNTVALLEKAGDRIKKIIENRAKTPVAVDEWLSGEKWFAGAEIVEYFNDTALVDVINVPVSDDDGYTVIQMAAKIKTAPDEIVKLAASMKIDQERKINEKLQQLAREELEKEQTQKINNDYAQSILNKIENLL